MSRIIFHQFFSLIHFLPPAALEANGEKRKQKKKSWHGDGGRGKEDMGKDGTREGGRGRERKEISTKTENRETQGETSKENFGSVC